MSLLKKIWTGIQRELFPALEEAVGHLTGKEKHFVEVLALTDLPSHMAKYEWKGKGRKKKRVLSSQGHLLPRLFIICRQPTC